MSLLVAAAQWSSSGEPLWSMAPKAIAPLMTAIVAVGVAVAGYLKFLRGRIFKPRLSLDLSAGIVRVAGSPALHVHVSVKNSGQSAVVLDPNYQQTLSVFVCDDAVWKDAAAYDDGVVLWYDGKKAHRKVEVLSSPGLETYPEPPYVGDEWGRETTGEDRGVLEPGEKWRVAQLIPVAPAHAYLIKLTIAACSHAGWMGRRRHRRCLQREVNPNQWSAVSVIPPSEESQREVWGTADDR